MPDPVAKHTPRASRLLRWIPALAWLHTYQWAWLRLDLIAGLTTASVIMPKAMAYAAIAGLPLEVGLYTCFIPLLVYALLGTSRPLSVSTSATLGIMTFAAISHAVPGGSTAELLTAVGTLSVLVGVFLILAGLLGLGAVASLISEPVLTGFKAGVGLIVIFDQIPKLLGLNIEKAGFFQDALSIIQYLPQTSLITLLLSALMLALILGLEYFATKAPAALITVMVGIALSALFGLGDMGVSVVGSLQGGLPSLEWPDLDLLQQLWPSALGIALMSFVESAAAGRAFLHKGEATPEANHELMATGMANLLGGLFHIMPAGGGTSQTAVNEAAGARSQLAAIFSAAVVLLTLLFLAQLIALLPHATLAAVVIMASISLCNPASFKAIRRIRIMEFRWALVALFGVLLLGTLNGVIVAVLASLVAMLMHANHLPLLVLGRKPGTNVYRPLSAEHPEDETFPGLLLLRPEGWIYFGNVARIGQLLRELISSHEPRVIALHLRAVSELEYTALQSLSEAVDRLGDAGIELWLVGMNPEVLEVVQKSGLAELLGRRQMFFNLEQAVAHYQQEFAGTSSS